MVNKLARLVFVICKFVMNMILICGGLWLEIQDTDSCGYGWKDN